MARHGKPRILSERRLKWMLNLYPPLLLQRVRTVRVGRDCRSATVKVHRSFLTRNLAGTTFGGTIFSGADPFYAILYWQALERVGERVHVWLKSADIRYVKPARSDLTLEFRLQDEDIARAQVALDRDGRFTRTHRTEAVDEEREVCAVVDTEVYVRRVRRPEKKEVSAF